MKKSFYVKQKVVLILLAFSVVAFAGIIYTLTSSSKLDKEHISLVENSEKIETKVYNARISLTEYLETKEEEHLSSVNTYLAKAYNNVEVIKEFVSKRSTYKAKAKEKFLLDLGGLNESIIQLDELMKKAVSSGNDDNLNVAMKHFSEGFTQFEKALHVYINESNQGLKREIFVLLASIFILLVVSLILIIRLMNYLIQTHRQLVRNTMTVEQRERKRIAMDLHDGLGAMLSSVGMYGKILKKELKDDQKSLEKLNQITQLSKQALDTVAEVINNLNPSVLNRYSLVESLERLCSKINNLDNVAIKLNTEKLIGTPQPSTEVILYRICSELINNTLKHAGADKISIELSGKNTLHLHYKDNGKGFNFDPKMTIDNQGMGLQNIMERVESIDGQYEINTAPQKGFEISIEFAISKQK